MSSIFGSLTLSFLIALGLTLGSAVSRQQVVSSVTIDGQVRLDNAANFDFRRLSMFIQHRLGKGHSWTIDGSVAPDESGRFVTTVPAGNWISIEVTTTDPTIRHGADAPGNEGVGFYELEKKQKETVLLKEFYIPAGPSAEIEQTIELYRGAAFSTCIPPEMKSGSMQFYLQSEKHRYRTSVVDFAESDRLRESFIGGLAAGQWEVLYVDDNNQIRKSQQLDLRSGQTMDLKCPKTELATTQLPVDMR